MAWIDDLLSHITDLTLREKLRTALAEIRGRRQFGLVFEHHIPETVLVPNLRPKRGSLVVKRDGSWTEERIVESVSKKQIRVRHPQTAAEDIAKPAELVVVKPFGEPIYPSLVPLGSIVRHDARPWHAVISSENYHALQMLLYLHEGQVDCIYLDPPYNTGARDWTYNNRFVDANDAYRHSKWLSFMEKRLRIVRRLLKPDGVLIVTIDENEVHHLGMLLERLFPDARRQMVTICINPSGASGEGLSRVEEYAFFCFMGGSPPVETKDDLLSPLNDEGDIAIQWESLLRRGNTWYRARRYNLCYPVFLDPDTERIVGVGEPLDRNKEDDTALRQAATHMHVAWPIRSDGKLGIWRVDGAQLMNLVSQGYAYATSRDDARNTWTIKYLMSGTVDAIEMGLIEVTGRGPRDEVLLRPNVSRSTTAKTVWHRGRHTAGGSGGTQLLASMLGEKALFAFPKSVYAVRDCIHLAVGDRRDALVVDVFAGSGTTLNAVCLLNEEDDGHRRCILVTNNEVDPEVAKSLNDDHHYRGDPRFEAFGIFERVTRPRCEAMITGRGPDGLKLVGKYLTGQPYSNGFAENVEFFRVEYLDPNEVSLGRQFDAILPMLWLTAGARTTRPTATQGSSWLIEPHARFAVLLDPDRFRDFAALLTSHLDITHVWIVTDDELSFARMRSRLARRLRVGMLYREYLRNFMINTERSI